MAARGIYVKGGTAVVCVEDKWPLLKEFNPKRGKVYHVRIAISKVVHGVLVSFLELKEIPGTLWQADNFVWGNCLVGGDHTSIIAKDTFGRTNLN